MQHDHPVGVGHLVAEMRRPQHGDGALRAHRQHQLDEIAAALRVEPDRRLVHQQQARLVQQRARKLDPAAVAAGELRGLVVGALGEAEPCQLLLDARLGDRARNAVQAGMEQKIGGDGELEVERRLLEDDAEPRQRRHRIARHVVAHHLDAAGIGGEQAGEQLEQRRLAGAIGAEQGDELAGMGGQADAVDGADRAIGLDDVVQQQGRCSFWILHP